MSALLLLSLAVGATAQSFAPSFGACSSSGSPLRLAGTPQQGNQTLSAAESTYVAARKALVPASLKTYLGDRSSTVYGASLDEAEAPTIGIAISGGGNRAALYGAGVLASLDGRNATAMAMGTGGLLQATTYISGLSGGSWMLSSFVFNDMPTIYDMVLGNETTGAPGWLLTEDLFVPGNATSQAAYSANIFADLQAKRDAGFPVTFNDYWSRALSYHFLPGTSASNFLSTSDPNHAASLAFSSAVELSTYQQHLLPFPLIVANVYSVNSRETPLIGVDVSLQNVVYEMNPLEFGSYDPELAAFIPMEQFGTAADSGTPVGGTAAGNCVTGFDNAGVILGISSNLFNFYNISSNIVWTNPLSPVFAAWQAINSTFYDEQSTQQLDIAAIPNPFKGINAGTFEDANQDQLRLLDGGLNNEVNPIAPLAVEAREVDVMIVADATGDSDTGTPIGSSLITTQLRSHVLPNGTQTLPPFPKTTDTFIKDGLADRPTFFGCAGTAAKLNGQVAPASYPMVIFLPNSDPTGVTNTTTGQLVYPNNQTTAFLDTTFALTTRGIPTNGTADPEWATCLACAVVERMRGKKGVDQTAACTACFTRYCWNEVEWSNSTTNGTGGTMGGSGATGGVGRKGVVGVVGGLAMAVVAAVLI